VVVVVVVVVVVGVMSAVRSSVHLIMCLRVHWKCCQSNTCNARSVSNNTVTPLLNQKTRITLHYITLHSLPLLIYDM